MEKPGVDKIIVFLIIALLPVFALTIIPKILLGIFQSNIDSLLSDGFYKASIITAAVIFVIILILSAYHRNLRGSLLSAGGRREPAFRAGICSGAADVYPSAL